MMMKINQSKWIIRKSQGRNLYLRKMMKINQSAKAETYT